MAVRAADDSGYPPRAEGASIETDRVSRLFVEKLNVRVPSEDTDLIEAGLLDSLALVELLLRSSASSACCYPSRTSRSRASARLVALAS